MIIALRTLRRLLRWFDFDLPVTLVYVALHYHVVTLRFADFIARVVHLHTRTFVAFARFDYVYAFVATFRLRCLRLPLICVVYVRYGGFYVGALVTLFVYPFARLFTVAVR